MAINFAFEQIKPTNKLKKARTKAWIKDIINLKGKKVGDLSYIFCNDEYLLGINKDYLNHDYYTDIITFDYTQEDIVSGDMFISLERVRDNASELNVAFEQELYRVIIHGVLHLLGQKDKSKKEASQMRKTEEECLKMLML